MLFMPMAVFLPCLFRPMQKLWLFALTMFLLLVAVEALQLLLACGSCDIDDVLLNLVGTLIVFGHPQASVCAPCFAAALSAAGGVASG